MNNANTISIIGLGYIGLPTAAIFAHYGHQVIGVDISEYIVKTINQGNIHIQEHGLEELVKNTVQSGNLKASLEPVEADVHIIAVPTPINHDKSPDLSYVKAATLTLCKVLKKDNLVIIESTIPPRTCIDIVAPLIEQELGLDHLQDYHLVHCPERVIPGKILEEIVYNDRIIGGTRVEATKRAANIYSSFVKGELLLTTATTAEMCKLMENTYRDVNIALANELAIIAKEMGIDISEAIELANHHPRVNIHTPSIGVGGHCIPIDPWFIVNASPEKARLIHLSRSINDERPFIILSEIEEFLATHAHERHVAMLGLSYKPNVDDLRESPAVVIVETLANRYPDHTFLVAEPNIGALPRSLENLHNVQLIDLAQLNTDFNLLISLVAHEQFKKIPDSILESKNVLDTQRIWKKRNQKTRMAL